MTSHIGKLFPHLDGKFPEGRNPLKDEGVSGLHKLVCGNKGIQVPRTLYCLCLGLCAQPVNILQKEHSPVLLPPALSLGAAIFHPIARPAGTVLWSSKNC